MGGGGDAPHKTNNKRISGTSLKGAQDWTDMCKAGRHGGISKTFLWEECLNGVPEPRATGAERIPSARITQAKRGSREGRATILISGKNPSHSKWGRQMRQTQSQSIYWRIRRDGVLGSASRKGMGECSADPMTQGEGTVTQHVANRSSRIRK